MRPKNIAVGELVVSPLNVREDIGDIQSLAESIRDDGLLHPLTVRPYGDQYEIVAGRRRYEACKLIGMKVIPCNEAEEMDDRRADLDRLFRVELCVRGRCGGQCRLRLGQVMRWRDEFVFAAGNRAKDACEIECRIA